MSIDKIYAHVSCSDLDRSTIWFEKLFGRPPDARQMAGLVEWHHAITKRGNRYIRTLLVLAATSLLNVVGKRKGALRDWIAALLAKKPARLVTVALANKLARILWAMMKTGESFRKEIFARA